MVEPVYTRHSKRRPFGDESSNLSLATYLIFKQFCRRAWVSVGFHTADSFGSIPKSATAERARVFSFGDALELNADGPVPNQAS